LSANASVSSSNISEFDCLRKSCEVQKKGLICGGSTRELFNET
jgi:hypothetical protein